MKVKNALELLNDLPLEAEICAQWYEKEDMVRPGRAPAGRAIFSNEFPVNRSREVVGPVDLPQGWIPRGRDLIVEQSILRRLQRKLLL